MSLSERKPIQAPKHESGQKATQSLRNIFAEERNPHLGSSISVVCGSLGTSLV